MSSLSSWEHDGEVVLVSACILGHPVRYDGTSRPIPRLPLRGMKIVPVCPEVLGGLATPRPSQEMKGGDGFAVLDGKARVVNIEGVDTTDAFLRGANAVLEIARNTGAVAAILKARSPACGCFGVWINGELKRGVGVTAALLKRNGIPCLEADRT